MKRMNKFAALFLSAALVMACAACGNDAGTGESGSSASEESSVESTEESSEGSEAEGEESGEASDAEGEASGEDSGAEGEAASGDVISHAEYIAAENDTQVVVETYVQAKQSWWDNTATIYAQGPDGAYFIYNMACSEEDYEKLTPGTKIRVAGFKGEWSGEVEIMDGAFEFVEGGDTFVAEPLDVTALLGKDELIDHQNEFVSFKGMTVEPAEDGSDAGFRYKSEDGDDLYFNVSYEGQTYAFVVESYLCDNTTDVYNAVKNLKVGDKIDMEGFLYWYEGVNPHITSVTAAE